jgi:hypothetical protein
VHSYSRKRGQDYAVGQGWSELDTAYFRQNSDISATFFADTDSPSGIRLNLTNEGASGNPRYIRRDDTVIADGTWTRAQVRARMRVPNTNQAAGLIGYGSSTSFVGVLCSKNVSNPSGRFSRLNEQAMDIWSTGTQLEGGIGDLVDREFLMDIGADKRTIRVRIWDPAGAEPGTWNSTFTTTADVSMSLGLRIYADPHAGGSTLCTRVPCWRVAIDADAPPF